MRLFLMLGHFQVRSTLNTIDLFKKLEKLNVSSHTKILWLILTQVTTKIIRILKIHEKKPVVILS